MLNKILVFIVIHYKLFKLLFIATKKGYLCEIGWIDSYKTQTPVNKKLQPIPWVTYSFISYIENRLNKSMSIFEYGSGNSTFLYAEKVNRVISVEHDKKWHEKLKENIPENVKLIHCELKYGGDYSKSVVSTDRKFSIIIVDGRDRVNCILNSTSSISQDGVLILDDSEREEYQNGVIHLKQLGYNELDFWGIAPGIFYNKCTPIFYKDNNCLGI